jgi:cell division protein ZapA
MPSVPEESLRVYIGGDEYSIKSDADPSTTKKVADYVDRKVMELQKSIPSRDKLKIAVISALNIAGELLECRKQYEQLKQQLDEIQRKTEIINRKIDSNL